MFRTFSGGLTAADQLIHAYNALAQEAGDWVGFAEMRAELPDIDHEEFDQTIAAVAEHRNVWLTPEMNQKMLTQADWDAAVWIGGEWKHLISIKG